jgi:hypothetical protein
MADVARDDLPLVELLGCKDVDRYMRDLPIAKLNLPIRLINILESNSLWGASNVGQLLRMTRRQLAAIPNVGARSIVMIEDELRNLATGFRNARSRTRAGEDDADDKMIIVKSLWEPVVRVCGSSPRHKLWYFDVLGPESASSFAARK